MSGGARTAAEAVDRLQTRSRRCAGRVLRILGLGRPLAERRPATLTVAHTTAVLAHAGAPGQIAQPARVEFPLNALMVVPMPLQGVFLPDRAAQTTDVVSNTLGACVGGGLGLLAQSARRRICANRGDGRNSAV